MSGVGYRPHQRNSENTLPPVVWPPTYNFKAVPPVMPTKPLSLRARLLLLLAAPFALLAGLSVYHGLSEREAQLADGRKDVLSSAHLLAAEQRQITASVHQTMLQAALLPEVSRAVASEQCDRTLADILKQAPDLANIALALPNGDVFCNAIATTQRISIADRDHFKGAMQARKFAVGGYVISRSSGKPSLGFGLPLLDTAGAVRLVIVVSANLDWLRRTFDAVQLPKGAGVTLVDAKGLLLGRYPDPEGLLGKQAVDLPLLKRLLDKSGSGSGVVEDTGMDGQPRVFGFMPLSQTISGPTYLWVSVPKDAFISAADHRFRLTLSVELALLLALSFALWFGSESLFVRRIGALTQDVKKMGQGDWTAFSGTKIRHDEIGGLEQSFVQMTQALQTKVADLEHSEERFRGLIEQSLTGIYITQDGFYRYANPRLEELLGYGSGELVGLRFADLVAEEDLPIVLAQAAELRAGKDASSYEVRVRRKDGKVIYLGVQGRIYSLDGHPATIGMAQDITAKRSAEEQTQLHLTQMHTALLSTIDVARTLSELRDPYTAGHERRVGKLAAAIGTELGLDEQRTEGLRVAGYLHDIGKITIPAEILSRAGKLSAIEYTLIQAHAQASYEVLKGVQFPWPVAQAALQHHERLDGSGYPQGLKGEAIVLEARILAVADVVEAMASHRPYRPALGIEAALAEIERGRATLYDTPAVDACLTLFRDRGFTIAEDARS